MAFVKKEYQAELKKMTDEQLDEETKEVMVESAFWSRESHDSHDKFSLCTDELLERYKEGSPDKYRALYEEVVRGAK